MQKILLVCLAMSCFGFGGCASAGWEQTVADLQKGIAASAEVASRTASGLEIVSAKVDAASAAMGAKMDAALDELDAAGFDTSSSGSLWQSVKDNPEQAVGSAGALSWAFLALFTKYKRNRKAVLASTDAFAAMSPAAQEEFKKAAQASAHMSPDVAGLIAREAAR